MATKSNSKSVPSKSCLLMTDTHLHKNNIDLVKSIFQQAILLCVERKINRISHLGDFFTSREAQPLEVLSQAQEIFNMLTVAGISIEIIPGNHDKVDLESEKSYLRILRSEIYGNLIDSESSSFSEVNSDLNILWLPYFKEKGSYLRRLKNLIDKYYVEGKKNILMTHIAINGVQNNDGSTVENDLKSDLFKCFYKVFSGHYHCKQSADNIYYIGSAYQANFGEDNLKGFTILHENGDHEFVKSKFPEFIKVNVNITGTKDDVAEIKRIKKEYGSSEDHVRVVLVGEKEVLQSFKKSDLSEQGIDVKFNASDVNTNVDISNQEITVYNRSNISQAFDSFCEINSISDKEEGQPYLEKILV